MYESAGSTSGFSTAATTVNRDGEWAIGEGLFLLALGAFSLLIAIAGESTAIVALPFLLLFRAVDEFISSFEGEPFGGVWHVVLAGVSMLASVLLLSSETVRPVSPALFPIGYFIVDGALRIIAAVKMRHRARWTWLLAVGIASITLGLIGMTPIGEGPVAMSVMIGLACLASGAAATGRGVVFRKREQRRLAISR